MSVPPAFAAARTSTPGPGLAAVALALALLTAVRLLALVVSPIELGPDETQYWRWAQTPDWGYFSKPPLIAWVIGFTTGLFGEGEAAVRLASPIAHGLGALGLYLAGRRLGGPWAGVWATAAYALMPGVWLSSAIMSTDALFLPCLCGALWAWTALRDGVRGPTQWAFAVGLGFAIGLGFLAKYAMIYGLIGLAFAILVDAPTRRALLSPAGVVAGVIAAAWLAPNLAWNAANDFETLGHTVDNANWANRFGLNLENFPKYITDQMAVFGPVSLVALVLAATSWRRQAESAGAARLPWLALAGFIVVPLVVIAVQAVLSRAHANWAAGAYPAACLLLGAALVSRPAWRWGVFGSNIVIGGLFLVGFVAPAVADAMGAGNAFKRVRGWEATAEAVATAVANGGPDGQPFTAILTDEREVFHGLDYYGVRTGRLAVPLRAWRKGEAPGNFADGTYPMTREISANVLVLSFREGDLDRLKADFEAIAPAGEVVTPISPGRVRRLSVYVASGFAPLPRTAAYEVEMTRRAAAAAN